MSISTYAELVTAAGNFLHRSDLSSSIPDFISLGESRINADLRVRQMEASTTVATTSAALPSDYVELKNAYISSTSPYQQLERKSPEWIYQNYPDRTSSGLPKFIAREGSSFIFGPAASDYTMTIVYYKRLSALSSSTNSVFTSYPGLYLFAALCESAPFLKNDSRIVVWEAKYQDILKLISDESKKEEFSGSNLRVTPG